MGQTLSETIGAVSAKFQCKIKDLLFLSGGLVDDISLIRYIVIIASHIKIIPLELDFWYDNEPQFLYCYC